MKVEEYSIQQEYIYLIEHSFLKIYIIISSDFHISFCANGIVSFILFPLIILINKCSFLNEKMIVSKNNKDIYYSSWLPGLTNKVLLRALKYDFFSAIKILYSPETVSIEITRKHNQHCNNKFISDPNFNTIRNYIDQALSMGTTVITFTEGESLFNDDIYNLIKYVDKKKSIVNLFCWGLNLTYDKAILLRNCGLQTIFISLYSVNPKIHDNIRGINGSYYKAINAMKIAKRAGLIVSLTTHINRVNCELELNLLYDLACKLEVNEFSIWEEIPSLRNKCPNDSESITKILKFQQMKNNKSNNKNPKVFTNILFEKYIGQLTGRKWAHIDVEGNVYPDPYTRLPYGNLHNKTLKECWKLIINDKDLVGKNGKHPLYDKKYFKKVMNLK